MYQARNVTPAFARNARFNVTIRPYSLAPGEVGKLLFQPVKMSAHRSAKAARRALNRLISGADNGAAEYLKSLQASGVQAALYYYAQETTAPFVKHAYSDLKGL